MRATSFIARQKMWNTFVFLLFTLCLIYIAINTLGTWNMNGKCPYVWHGGSPIQSPVGSCWCGADSYCMCTPSLAIDCIIEFRRTPDALHTSSADIDIILVWRKMVPQDIFAIPGGFVNVGETVEEATIREVKEETNLTVKHLEQFRMYSDPARDSRRHTASMVFRCVVASINELCSGDDAKIVRSIPLNKVLLLNLAFDHKQIVRDYIKHYYGED